MMKLFAYLFLAGVVVSEFIRYPHRMRQKQEWDTGRSGDQRMDRVEVFLLTLSFFALYLFPLLYAFSNLLEFADYTLPLALPIIGLMLLVGSLFILWRAHADLGTNWAATPVVWEEQKLVEQGLYKYVRHPIYLAMWLMVIAQALMLANGLAGLAGIAVYLLIYLYRVPREEQMMLSHFGESYKDYMQRTGRLLPRLR